ncbi:MAG TPA: adenylate/guanylate cyclase domain-containing protein [Pseudomonadota bacterium]|nr:adenylate/guanylate cyclase domain-containing protein [Pseudomonadota bacterium]
MANTSLRISPRVHLWLLCGTVLSALFGFVYARLVCQYICALPTDRLARNIAIVSLAQFALRHHLLTRPIPWQSTRTTARTLFLRSVLSWFVAGALAIGLHFALYPDFPVGSHFKFALAYWALGGGLCTQLEYLLFEQEFPAQAVDGANPLRERLRDRLIEGYAIYTLTPALVLLLTLLRVVRELGGTTQQVIESALLMGVFAGMALLAALLFGRSLRKDSERLMEAVRKVGQGDFSPRAKTTRADELSQVAVGINEMASGLLLRERIRDAFGRFVSPQVATEFIETYAKSGRSAELGGKRRDVVILFSDLRDFTPLSESLPPERLIEVLNGYFAEMVAAIHQQHGIVDKFIGDAVLAVFGLVDSPTGQAGENPAISAVRAAQTMQRQLRLYNDTLRQQGIQLSAGIGIHAGEVIAGYLGTHERMEYTVIGHNVNIAARLESKAREPLPTLLFSDEVARRIGHTLPVRAAGEVQLKGVTSAMPVFTVDEPPTLPIGSSGQ